MYSPVVWFETFVVGEDYTGKPYRYDCMAGDSENIKSVNEIEMVVSFEM